MDDGVSASQEARGALLSGIYFKDDAVFLQPFWRISDLLTFLFTYENANDLILILGIV
jgi:hypothetical protein